MPRKQPGPPCVVCGKSSTAKNLCETHYKRFQRHGHLDTTRPDDWGERNKHPLNHTWRWTGEVGRESRWDDFWTFVVDVGDRPTQDHRLRRLRLDALCGPDNFYWGEPVGVAGKTKARKAAYAKVWRARNPLRAKQNDLKRMFGISLADYEEMLAKQNGVCAICENKDAYFKLAVDHCHVTGVIRGLLCSQCNRGLGCLGDSPERLRRAIAYLERAAGT